MKIKRVAKIAFALLVLIIVAGPSQAAPIEFVRGLQFDSHTAFYDFTSDRTNVIDRYLINSVPLVLANDTYDTLQFDLGVRPTNRFVVDDVPGPIRTSVDASWRRANSIILLENYPYTVSYINGSGDLPAAVGDGQVGLSSNGDWLLLGQQLTDVNGGYAFEKMRFSSSFGPYNGGGQYDQFNGTLSISYSLPGNVPDPGRFTGVVLIPEPNSLALLGLGGVLMIFAKRRRRG